MRDVEARAREMQGQIDQLPYVMSRILNDAAFAVRGSLVKETWPQHVQQKSTGFPGAVLHVEKATKQNLTVSIVETRETTVNLKRHAEGGTKSPRQAARLAIPPRGAPTYQRTA